MLSITTRHWAVLTVRAGGGIAHADITSDQPEAFPVTPRFWRYVEETIKAENGSAWQLAALTPLAAPLETTH